MALGYVNKRFESIPGNEFNTPILGTKDTFQPAMEFSPKLNAEPMPRDDEIRNLDEKVPVIPESFAPEWDMESRMYPDIIGMTFAEAFGYGANYTLTAGNGVITDPDSVIIPTGAYRHVWSAPFGPAGLNPQTSQIIAAYKDQNTFFKIKGAATEKFTIASPEKGGCTIKASGKALYMERTADPALTPAYESLSIRPFVRGNLKLQTWLSNTATTEDFTLECESPIDTVRSLGEASYYPDAMEKGEGLIMVKGSIPKRSLDPDDYDALVNSTGFTGKARWQSESIIASGYPYKLFAEFSNLQYVGGEPDGLSNKRRIGASFDWAASRLTTSSVVFTLINATPSYSI